ncbi:hypothetical protein MANES_06G170450v8 [Manihot esculenta]|uniref:Uncharacterized protein n=1 Tax=Manihot esculenta TaxID=3983 RepID=A0ACB7HLG9_MANES|nr:hypothetical protein MANES_06G170450v8 [Manihot esculenta]
MTYQNQIQLVTFQSSKSQNEVAKTRRQEQIKLSLTNILQQPTACSKKPLISGEKPILFQSIHLLGSLPHLSALSLQSPHSLLLPLKSSSNIALTFYIKKLRLKKFKQKQ